MRLPVSIPVQAAALLAAAGLCAVIGNAFAGPRRHLVWTASPAVAPTVLLLKSEPIPDRPQSAPAVKIAPTATPLPKPLTPKPTPLEPVKAERPSQPVREITSAEAWEAFQKGAAFLDARRSADFEAGHIQGAFGLPVWESTLDQRLVEFEAKANQPPEAPLVLYCSGGSCEDSHLLASRLFQMGYRNLLIYRDGFPDWQAQGRPVVLK